ncbi:hypothetical protein AD998_05250 [bacterium 336/3]|nr:hypothetical protein AD998_05250 [bacterium 336/3]
MLPLKKHANTFNSLTENQTPLDNFLTDKSIFFGDVDDYYTYRCMAFALGAKVVYNKMMSGVDLIIYGKATPPPKAVAKYPDAILKPVSELSSLFHQHISTFKEFIKALQNNGFTIRNFSDEGDPEFDFFELDLINNSIHDTLMDYLKNSSFINGFIRTPSFPIDKKSEAFSPLEYPKQDITWWYLWTEYGWNRVGAQKYLKPDDEYAIEIKGDQLLSIEHVFWSESTGLYFYEYPDADSISGLFIQAGIDRKTGKVHGASISRVWT